MAGLLVLFFLELFPLFLSFLSIFLLISLLCIFCQLCKVKIHHTRLEFIGNSGKYGGPTLGLERLGNFPLRHNIWSSMVIWLTFYFLILVSRVFDLKIGLKIPKKCTTMLLETFHNFSYTTCSLLLN